MNQTLLKTLSLPELKTQTEKAVHKEKSATLELLLHLTRSKPQGRLRGVGIL